MDDSLVEAFEEEQQINVYGGDDIKTGSEVEVKNVAEGLTPHSPLAAAATNGCTEVARL